MQRFILLFGLIWLISAAGCSPKYTRVESNYPTVKSTEGGPDYADLFYWAAHPDKDDPSDSVPKPLQKKKKANVEADVFFIHPTTLTARDDSQWNASLTDAKLNAKTDYSTILYQASTFNECRVFAPRYRQAHLRSYYTAGTKGKEALDFAYEDVKNAFIYYLQHFNNGRPIIIASHSQGSTHAQRLLKEFFDGTELQKKLVMAYMPGMYIPPDYFSVLKPCNDAKETGCYAGWRTFKKGYEPDFVTNEKSTCQVTNPLTWKTSDEYAGYSLNKGGVTTKFNHVIKSVTDGQIHDGMLWINRPRIPGSIFLKLKNFHIGDINLFYVNIRENLRLRVENYYEHQPGTQVSQLK